MNRTRRRRLARWGPAAIAGLVLIASSVAAQSVTEPALKAAFIYNFARFTDWPADPASGREPFLLCVVGDAAVGAALVRAVHDRTLGGHVLSVAITTAGEPPPTCRLLYISGVPAARAAQMLAGLRDVPVLTIGDLEEFIELGGVAKFFFEYGQLRFSVDRASATRAQLRISSKLLALAIRK
jgi:hypothetical protein